MKIGKGKRTLLLGGTGTGKSEALLTIMNNLKKDGKKSLFITELEKTTDADVFKINGEVDEHFIINLVNLAIKNYDLVAVDLHSQNLFQSLGKIDLGSEDSHIIITKQIGRNQKISSMKEIILFDNIFQTQIENNDFICKNIKKDTCECSEQLSISEITWDCEAIHLGLSLEELKHYKELRKEVNICSEIINNEYSDKARKDLSNSVRRLLEFEEIHQII